MIFWVEMPSNCIYYTAGAGAFFYSARLMLGSYDGSLGKTWRTTDSHTPK
jgi:hypothetical protein